MGTHSALLKGSHTRAHTPKQGPSLPRPQCGFALPAKSLLFHHAFIYIHFPVLCEPPLYQQREKSGEAAAISFIPTVPHCVFQLLAQTAHVRFHSRKWVHPRLHSKDRTQRLTRRNRGRFRWGWYHCPRSVPRVSETLRGQGVERQTLPLLGLGRGCSRRTQKAFGTAMRLCASLFRGVAAPLGCAASSAIWRCCFFRSAFGTFCMCEARGVSPLSACSTCRRNAGRPLVKTTNLLFPWSDRFFFDSSSTKYYPFFFTDTGRTSGRPAGSFAFVCISLTCPDRPDRGT